MPLQHNWLPSWPQQTLLQLPTHGWAQSQPVILLKAQTYIILPPEPEQKLMRAIQVALLA